MTPEDDDAARRPKPPKTKARLEQLITQWQKDSGVPVARLNLRIAAMMPRARWRASSTRTARRCSRPKAASRWSLWMGGRARATRDIALVLRGHPEQLAEQLDAALREPYNGFTFRRGEIDELPARPSVKKVKVQISFAGRILSSPQLEIAPLDTGHEEFVAIPATKLDAVGLDGPDVVLVLAERWQIAQKLHAPAPGACCRCSGGGCGRSCCSATAVTRSSRCSPPASSSNTSRSRSVSSGNARAAGPGAPAKTRSMRSASRTRSFVGRLVAGYLAGHAPQHVRIALAGRSPERLERTRGELGRSAADWPLIVADSADEASMHALARDAKVVATTVGPYRRHGLKLVDACIANGTDYVDLSGPARVWLHHPPLTGGRWKSGAEAGLNARPPPGRVR